MEGAAASARAKGEELKESATQKADELATKLHREKEGALRCAVLRCAVLHSAVRVSGGAGAQCWHYGCPFERKYRQSV